MDKAAIGRRDSVGLRSLAASGTLAPVPTRTCAGHLLQLLGVCALLLLPQPAGQLRAAPQAPTAVPSPRDVLGFEPGDDYTLADFRQLRAYFQRLDAASDRVQLEIAGQSTEGNEMLVAIISSEANLARLGHYRDISRRLALVGGLSDREARALAREGKAVVWIDSGLHASEVATAQHAIRLAYRVATDDSAEMQAIRDNVILVLAPCINPDGMNMVVDWYRRTLHTPHQDSPMPWLYQKYVGHDNNRDGYMQTQKETQVVSRLLFAEWLPQIMYNQHQGTYPPRIFVPPFPDPVNPNIDPQIVRGVDLVGGAMQDRFEREGKDGVISRYSFSIWYNGSVRTTSYFHNIIGILTETGHASATPYTYDPADFPRTLSNGVSTLVPSVTYPNPWKGGTLHLADAVDYMLTGSLGVLDLAAKWREQLLYGIYQVGARQIAKGRTEAPVAYIIPAPQHDVPASMAFIDTLMKGGIEVHRATAPLAADGVTYPAGTHAVLLAQPFRPFAKDLLERQVYPDLRAHPGGPPIPPYDTAGWTLAYQMGVTAVPVATPFDTTALVRLETAPRAAGAITIAPGSGPWGYVIDDRANVSALAVNRLLAHGAAVSRLRAPFSPRPGVTLPAGAWVIKVASRGGKALVAPESSRASGDSDMAFSRSQPAGARNRGPGLAALVSRLVEDLGLRAWSIDRAPADPTQPIAARRIGLYKSWVANIDEGWTRWLLEQYGFPYATLVDRDVRAGDLRRSFDVIILPRQSPAAIVRGHEPSASSRHDGPSNPVPPEYQGGIGESGVEALKRFVHDGGTLVTLDAASDLPLERFGGVFERIRDVTRGLDRSVFYCPGSVVRITVDINQPVAWGMARESAAYFEASRAFDTADPTVQSIAQYAPADVVLMSGWLLGADRIATRHALLDAPYGAGRVVLFAFPPQFRAQPHATFKLLFNALY